LDTVALFSIIAEEVAIEDLAAAAAGSLLLLLLARLLTLSLRRRLR
jgi:hypothetical protein